MSWMRMQKKTQNNAETHMRQSLFPRSLGIQNLMLWYQAVTPRVIETRLVRGLGELIRFKLLIILKESFIKKLLSV